MGPRPVFLCIMHEIANYLWKCIEITVRATWETADTVGVVFGIVIALVLIANPDREQSAVGILAKLTVLILVVVFLTRLATSPYLLYKQRGSDVTARDREIRNLNGEIDKLRGINKQLEQNNQLAQLLERQINAAKKGSLSSRANLVVQEIVKFESDRNARS